MAGIGWAWDCWEKVRRATGGKATLKEAQEKGLCGSRKLQVTGRGTVEEVSPSAFVNQLSLQMGSLPQKATV